MLYVCATPIGNLEDITLRVLRTLREVDAIVAEDTRQTRKLLKHYGIEKPLLSYHSHNWRQQLPHLLVELRQGRRLALVTDAGSPGVSDPGRELVAACRQEGLPVTVLPGPSAVTTAVMIAGLVADRWCFEGFLPRSGAARRRRLQKLAGEERAVVIFEAPPRLVRTLQDLAALMPGRRAAVARELTKVHEEIDVGSLSDLAARWAQREAKGEITLVLEAQEAQPLPDRADSPERADEEQRREQMLQRVAEVMAEGISRTDALRQVAREFGLSRRQLYQLLYATAADVPGSSSDESDGDEQER
ncbi:MAG: 16S rRNA (cytidine(1402)-2'-O)-methyltransferase [Limnochordales bacterium]|nr:16S rRNA (cytidine(1402)-2'-O)-methyltransferase [Limnochordales bacterium]